MKAWAVYDHNDCWFPIHAETWQKAVSAVRAESSQKLTVRGLSELDDIPFTWDRIGRLYRFEDGTPWEKCDFTNWCKCEICKPKG